MHLNLLYKTTHVEINFIFQIIKPTKVYKLKSILEIQSYMFIDFIISLEILKEIKSTIKN